MVQAGVDPGFTKWECQPQRGREPIIWPFFPEICMEIKKIERGRGGGGNASKVLLCRSTTAAYLPTQIPQNTTNVMSWDRENKIIYLRLPQSEAHSCFSN